MSVVAWLGPTVGATATTAVTGASSTLYPFSDPTFQNFNVQQYITLGSAGPTQTYAEKAPTAPEDESPAVKGVGHSKAGK